MVQWGGAHEEWDLRPRESTSVKLRGRGSRERGVRAGQEEGGGGEKATRAQGGGERAREREREKEREKEREGVWGRGREVVAAPRLDS